MIQEGKNKETGERNGKVKKNNYEERVCVCACACAGVCVAARKVRPRYYS